MIWKRWQKEYLHNGTRDRKKGNLKEIEVVWLVGDSVKRCEYHWRRILEVSTVNDCVVQSARVKMEHGELNQPVVKIALVFYYGVSQIENRAGENGFTSNQQQEPSDSMK